MIAPVVTTNAAATGHADLFMFKDKVIEQHHPNRHRSNERRNDDIPDVEGCVK